MVLIWSLRLAVLCCLCLYRDAWADVGGNQRQVVIAGNFTLDGERLSLAKYDAASKKWVPDYNYQVYKFSEDKDGVGEAEGGAIYDIAIDHSGKYDNYYAVGLFDSVSKFSQVVMCSVAHFNGVSFARVGEGLCSRGLLTSTLRLDTIVLGSNGDLFVGGQFHTRVWYNLHFADASHVAYFNASAGMWLPLHGGELKSVTGILPRVNSLVWNPDKRVLFIGGYFQALDALNISSGIALWTAEGGLANFGGLGAFSGEVPGIVQNMAFDGRTSYLYIAGIFDEFQGVSCHGLVTIGIDSDFYICHDEISEKLLSFTSILLTEHYLYLSGALTSAAQHVHLNATHSLVRLKIAELAHPPSCSDRSKDSDRVSALSLDLHPMNETRMLRGSDSDDPSPASFWPFQKHSQVDGRERVAPHSRSPTHLPSCRAVLPTTDWLPGFPGTMGPVLQISKGEKIFGEVLLISGELASGPALLSWKVPQSPSPSPAPSPPLSASLDDVENATVPLDGPNAIKGMVSFIAEVNLPSDHDAVLPDGPARPTSEPTEPPQSTLLVTMKVLSILSLVLAIGMALWLQCFPASPATDASIPMNRSSHVGEKSPNAPHRWMSSAPQVGSAMELSVNYEECCENARNRLHLSEVHVIQNISPSSLHLSSVIDNGTNGRVWRGKWGNSDVAIKEFVFIQSAVANDSVVKTKLIEEILGEAVIMSCLKSPKIIALYGCCLCDRSLWIVTELCVRGSLKMLLQDSAVKLPLATKLDLCIDIAEGMQYLHSRVPVIIHRDLKSLNIFIHEDSKGTLIAKIGDWGSARALDDPHQANSAKNMTFGVGTTCWLAPEVIQNSAFSQFSDVYAFGIIMWEVYTRQDVYAGMNAVEIMTRVNSGSLRPPIPSGCPDRWRSLMTSCWKQDRTQRPTFDAIVNELVAFRASLANQQSRMSVSQQPLLSGSSRQTQYDSFGHSAAMASSPSPVRIEVADEERSERAGGGALSTPSPRTRTGPRDFFHPSMENNEDSLAKDVYAGPSPIPMEPSSTNLLPAAGEEARHAQVQLPEDSSEPPEAGDFLYRPPPSHSQRSSFDA